MYRHSSLCELDKYLYNPGETALFSCSCTSGNEQNEAGYIVFLNSSGSILQNNSINSGLCINSLFSDTYTFPVGLSDYVGNVSFSLYGNGSGTPTNWGDSGDVINDTWNVSNATAFDCVIDNIIIGPGGSLGELGAVKIIVRESINFNPLVNVRCQAEAYDILGSPILFVPYGAGPTFRYTGSGGEVGFQHLFSESVWDINTNYLFEFHCHCPNANSSDVPCYDEVTGSEHNFVSCNRDVGKDIVPIILGLSILGLLFLVIGFITPNMGLKFFCFGIGLIEFLTLSFVLYADRASNTLVGILRTNFYVLLLFGLGFGLIGLILFVIKLINPADDSLEKEIGMDKKWDRK